MNRVKTIAISLVAVAVGAYIFWDARDRGTEAAIGSGDTIEKATNVEAPLSASVARMTEPLPEIGKREPIQLLPDTLVGRAIGTFLKNAEANTPAQGRAGIDAMAMARSQPEEATKVIIDALARVPAADWFEKYKLVYALGEVGHPTGMSTLSAIAATPVGSPAKDGNNDYMVKMAAVAAITKTSKNDPVAGKAALLELIGTNDNRTVLRKIVEGYRTLDNRSTSLPELARALPPQHQDLLAERTVDPRTLSNVSQGSPSTDAPSSN